MPSASGRTPAWFMLHRIREAMKDDTNYSALVAPGNDPVESDETFVGPNPYEDAQESQS